MAKPLAVWGIDIGQCALKALRCRTDPDDATTIAADAFDYIEYPKILSQPEVEPAALIREALELFLSRNTVHGDEVAISVSGQAGLTRFIKLPPVESKKIPDIVRYEAKQQIPFSLDEVVWDYEKLAGGSEEEGFALETEVGLFAMKRDQVERALEPFKEVGIEVDFIQLAPLAIYNAIVFDQMQDLPPDDEYDPDNPPPSLVAISMGTENTDLVVTNGFRVWQRSVPQGGNHFTKALSKELRLTFDKAEHLKRNATQAEDPKAVFQAMRPVFNDMLTEVQRSIGFFESLDRSAKISHLVALGNATKLPGLQRYLSQNLGYEVKSFDRYIGLTGGAVTAAPAFKENLFSFAVCYGLCLQGLGLSAMQTNLLPPELKTQKLLREKKPWAVAAIAALLVGFTVYYFGNWSAWNSAHPDHYKDAFSAADRVKQKSDSKKSDYQKKLEELDRIKAVGHNLISNVEGRLLWLEVLKAVDTALPKERPRDDPKPIGQRKELHVVELDCERVEDLAEWFAGVKTTYESDMKSIQAAPRDSPADPDGGDEDAAEEAAEGAAEEAAGEAEQPAAEAPGEGAPPVAAVAGVEAQEKDEETGEGPQGPGWIIQLKGYHYYNENPGESGATFVRRTLLKNLAEGYVALPNAETGESVQVSLRKLGLGYGVLVGKSPIHEEKILDPHPEPSLDAAGGTEFPQLELKKFNFIVQMAWQQRPPSARLKPAAESGTPAPADPTPATAQQPQPTGTAAAGKG